MLGTQFDFIVLKDHSGYYGRIQKKHEESVRKLLLKPRQGMKGAGTIVVEGEIEMDALKIQFEAG